MYKIVVNDIFDELREENNRLINDLLFAQKNNQLFEKYRHFLKSFVNNCKCDENIDNKNAFNLLENQYKLISNEKQLNNNIEAKLEFNETNVENNKRMQKLTKVSKLTKSSTVSAKRKNDNKTNMKKAMNEYKVSEKRNTSAKCEEEINLENNQLMENNNSIDDCNESENSSIDNQLNSDSNDETYNDSDYDSNKNEFNNKRKSNNRLKPTKVAKLAKSSTVSETRKNYSKEPHKTNMKKAMDDYYKEHFDSSGQPIMNDDGSQMLPISHFAARHDVDYRALRLRIQGKLSIDAGIGPKPKFGNHKKRRKSLNRIELSELSRLNKVVKCIDNENELISVLREKVNDKSEHSFKTGAKVGFGCNWNRCDFFSSDRRDLSSHIITKHTNEKPFSCDLCDSKFSLKKNLKFHKTYTHEKSLLKKLKCDWPRCPFEAYTKDKLKKHYLRHNESNKKYKCDEIGCEKSFFDMYHFNRHKNEFHSDFRPFVCEWPGCESAFKNKKGVKEHELTHSRQNLEDKPFVCDFPNCEKRYILKSRLNQHKMTHDVIKKFVCHWPGCDDSFYKRQYFIGHMNKHKGLRPFQCHWSGCQRSYQWKEALNRHLKFHQKQKVIN